MDLEPFLQKIAMHLNTPKYKNLSSQARSSRFLYVDDSLIMINNLTKEYNFEL